MKVQIDGKDLVIRIPFDEKGTLTASKKSYSHASSNGNKETEVTVNGKKLVVGVNAYTSAK